MSQREGFIILWKGLVRRAARHARGLPRRTTPLAVSKSGQHMTQYAILIGLVTLAAVTMQFMARRGVQTGLQMVSDTVLGPPPAPKPPDPADPVSTVSVQRCDDPVNPGAVVTATGSDLVLQVACAKVTEDGDSAFRRITTTTETSRGASVNENARLQVFKE